MSNDNGGPAFPVTPTDRSGQIAETCLGMTLHDYFAATVSMDSLSIPETAGECLTRLNSAGPWSEELWYELVAQERYRYAAAMLKARNA